MIVILSFVLLGGAIQIETPNIKFIEFLPRAETSFPNIPQYVISEVINILASL